MQVLPDGLLLQWQRLPLHPQIVHHAALTNTVSRCTLQVESFNGKGLAMVCACVCVCGGEEKEGARKETL